VTSPDLGVLAALVARQSADLAIYAEFLLGTLAGALPPEHLQVERKRGRLGRTADDAPVLAVSVTLGDRTFRLARPKPSASPAATVAHTVAGVTLSTKTLPVGEWSQQLATALAALAETNADAADALARLTRFTV
jgi:hypothetical protein